MLQWKNCYSTLKERVRIPSRAHYYLVLRSHKEYEVVCGEVKGEKVEL